MVLGREVWTPTVYLLSVLKAPKDILDNLDKVKKSFFGQATMHSREGNVKLTGLHAACPKKMVAWAF